VIVRSDGHATGTALTDQPHPYQFSITAKVIKLRPWSIRPPVAAMILGRLPVLLSPLLSLPSEPHLGELEVE
jgi:hypothetical protein